ncbi:MAG: hypothetical protein HQK53_08830 [Oligoflexia bacterium]|nr:hypothetical protein [Oligoflexia bacterium]
MSNSPKIDEMEKELDDVRQIYKKIRSVEFKGKGIAKSITLYSSDSTRHNVLLMKLEDETLVTKEVDNKHMFPLWKSLKDSDTVYVWYDQKYTVQQYEIYKRL